MHEKKENRAHAKRLLRLSLLLFPAVIALGFWLYQNRIPVTLNDLINPNTRLRAFHRLWLDVEHHEMYDAIRSWRHFQQYHQSIEILECPQGDEKESLYLVMRTHNPPYHFNNRKIPLSSWSVARDAEAWRNWWEGVTSPRVTRASPLLKPTLAPIGGAEINLVDSEGRLVHRPFDGNNVADGIMFDVNHDGYLERVGTTRYGGFDKKGTSPQEKFVPEVLNIVRVRRQQEHLFSIVLNIELIDDPRDTLWWYECADDGNGNIEIRIGPGDKKAPITPRVTLSWDEERKTFVERDAAPDKTRPYWILENDPDNWKQLEALHKSGELERYWKALDRD